MAYGHGKVILFGEHSVVHGRPALALAVERGAEVHAVRKAEGPTELSIAPWDVQVDAGGEPNQGRELLQSALKVAREFYEDDLELSLTATMNLPGGAGMGSSAALGVAVLRAMDAARGISRSDQEIFERSLPWERVFHGNASGIDNAMATYGGMAVFKKGESLTRIVPRHRVRLIAGHSGSQRIAKPMIESVARQFQKEPERVGKLFDAIASIVSNGKLALEQGDLKGLGQLMTMNHMLLSSLMLSTSELEEMIAAAMQAGALGAKLTGAGGGGCMIALIDNDEQHAAVKAALTGLGRTVYDVEAGPPRDETKQESGST
ncbi:MAG: mevalonate kinase [Myxococcales bacterium]